jgi:hypothetical protein
MVGRIYANKKLKVSELKRLSFTIKEIKKTSFDTYQ